MALDSNGSRLVTSPAQDGWWYLSQTGGHTPALRLAYRVTGPLDLDALRESWRVLTARHEALRTTLSAPGGVPERRVSAEATGELRVVTGAAPDGLDAGSLVRLTAVELGPAEHLLVLDAHRAVVDDESAAILLAELSRCYATITDSGEPFLPPLAVGQYSEFAQWQRDLGDKPATRAALDWWTSALTPPPPPIDLPADRPRRDGPASAGGVLEFTWNGVGTAVSALADAEGTTDDVVLLAVFQVLLHRLSGADQVPVGTPVSVRRPADAGQVGAYENLVVVDADLAGESTFGEHLHRVAATARSARANADVPFSRIVRAVCTDRDPLRTPLVDAVLEVRRSGHDARPELLVPMVSTPTEVDVVRGLLDDVRAHAGTTAEEMPIALGAMIETPRAALLAARLAERVDALSLGTNDLTALMWGLSRDDADRHLLPAYRDLGVVEHSPFDRLDLEGVGAVIRQVVRDARAVRPDIRIGVCGEQAAEATAVGFLADAGVDYVSCAAPRVPLARLAAARHGLPLRNAEEGP